MLQRLEWITLPKSLPELNGKSVELRISTPVLEIRGIGKMRVEPHPSARGKACLWVSSTGGPAFAFEQSDVDQIKPHPDPNEADYLCKVDFESRNRRRESTRPFPGSLLCF
jgi:hypothetical protein